MSDGRSDGYPFDELCEVSATAKPNRETQLRRVQDEALALFSRKNRDYGDAFADYGPVGVLVRLGDKLRRMANISSSGVTLVKNEGLRDTLLDLHNYAAMAIMLLDEDTAESATRQYE